MICQTYGFLADMVEESTGLPPVEHLAAHISNTVSIERKYARAYLGDQDTRDASQLRRQIAAGARKALEKQ